MGYTFPADEWFNLGAAIMDMEQAVAERKGVLESADLRRWCLYTGRAGPINRAEETRLRLQMMREIAECPYCSPEHRAAARAHLPRRRRPKPE
jgi:hypothetical protein